MCRLTLVYPKKDIDPRISLLLLSNIMNVNSLDMGNDDGTGVAINSPEITTYSKSGDPAYKFFTSENWFNTITKDWAEHLVPKMNLIGHVRSATPGIPVSDENSHPFIFDNLTSIHNGIIKNKWEFDKDLESDSAAFFSSLARKINYDILNYETLKTQVEKIRGAFCMIINDKSNDDPTSVWVVVGKARELYKIENDNFIIINTTQRGFSGVLDTALALRTMNYDGWNLLAGFDSAQKLTPETIYFVSDGSIINKGSVKENDYAEVKSFKSATAFHGNKKHVVTTENENRLHAKLWFDILISTNMSVWELYTLINLYRVRVGKNKITEWYKLESSDYVDISELFSYLKERNFLDDIDSKALIWEGIIEASQGIVAGEQLYEKLYAIDDTMQFPFWMNSIGQLNVIRSKLGMEAPVG